MFHFIFLWIYWHSYIFYAVGKKCRDVRCKRTSHPIIFTMLHFYIHPVRWDKMEIWNSVMKSACVMIISSQQPGVLSAVWTEGKCWVHLTAECGWVVACSGHWAATEWSPGAVCTLDTASNTSPDAIHGNFDNILHQDLGPALLIMQPNTQRRMTADTGWGLWWGTMLHSKCASQWPDSVQPVSSVRPHRRSYTDIGSMRDLFHNLVNCGTACIFYCFGV